MSKLVDIMSYQKKHQGRHLQKIDTLRYNLHISLNLIFSLKSLTNLSNIAVYISINAIYSY